MPDVRARYDIPELAPLWRVLWERFSSGRAVSSVRLRGLEPDQSAALADLLGLDRLPGVDASVSVRALDEALGPATGLTAREIAELIVGRLENRAETRLAATNARAELWVWLDEHPVVRAEPALAGWAAGIRRGGLIGGSAARTRKVIAQALSVLAALPSDGRPLSTLAGDVCDDTHALDDGTRTSALVLKALAAIHDEAPPQNAEERRACWERAGVECDALSTSVLTAGFRPGGTDPLSVTLQAWTDAGHAAVVTLAQLRDFGPPRGATVVHVVENPAMVAMATARFRSQCPPLVTTSGWPNSAAIHLLRRLAESGAQVRYHGDFDGEGVRIAAHVVARTGAQPWAMSAADYLAAVRPGRPDPGNITDAPWDPELSEAMRGHRATVSEEHVAEQLLTDLAAFRGPHC
ncbi:TIGR02679 family protein [Saccharopolyspora elongata]|uniref:TIGR02679 family protein n=1 Tax=Saccharopolyspora elongata TaxID=2530387 RepID=A0A4V2YNU3_9PSEU|nr:TIGR02679 family protein [Saccharopolyspora elongata]TDD55627.1 TIGR02679 family protein [Saccharopolyspora elongata]